MLLYLEQRNARFSPKMDASVRRITKSVGRLHLGSRISGKYYCNPAF